MGGRAILARLSVTVTNKEFGVAVRPDCKVLYMPRKIRQLLRDLKRAGFVNRGGKGPHRNYEHEKGIRVTLSGQLGDDAKPYQEKEVKRAIEEAKP